MDKTNIKHLGYQTMVDLYGCSSELINDKTLVENILLELTDLIDLTVVNSVVHHFSPIGVSGVVVIEESHVAVHTWPEHNYVAIDFFTCNQEYDIEKGIGFLKDKFEAQQVEINKIKRGTLVTIKAIKNKPVNSTNHIT